MIWFIIKEEGIKII